MCIRDRYKPLCTRCTKRRAKGRRVCIHYSKRTAYYFCQEPKPCRYLLYPGANAETVAQTVGIPIEQQVNGVDGMLYMSSNSSSSGAYSLTITFAVGTNIDMATVQVQNRVSIDVYKRQVLIQLLTILSL